MSKQKELDTVGFPELLTLLLIALKCTGYIGLSWWWVVFPVVIASAIRTLIYHPWGGAKNGDGGT